MKKGCGAIEIKGNIDSSYAKTTMGEIVGRIKTLYSKVKLKPKKIIIEF